MYDLAKKYYEENGSLLSITDANLRNWIQVQRQAYKGKGTYTKLSKQQIEQLEAIGMIWDVRQYQWKAMYQQAQEYFEQHGDLLVPRTDEYSQLYTWVKAQRRKYKSEDGLSQEEIPKEQLHKLKKLYHEQINFLESSIEADRQKILKIKNQL